MQQFLETFAPMWLAWKKCVGHQAIGHNCENLVTTTTNASRSQHLLFSL